MKISSFFKPIFLLTVFTVFMLPPWLHADEYKWLKSPKYKNLLVYTDFKECGFLKADLKETVKRLLMRSQIRPTMSDSLVFLSGGEGEETANELIDAELTDRKKIFFHIYGRCIEYGSVYIYQFDIHFARFDGNHSTALLYSKPQHRLVGADKIMRIKMLFRKLVEDALEDYVSSNK